MKKYLIFILLFFICSCKKQTNATEYSNITELQNYLSSSLGCKVSFNKGVFYVSNDMRISYEDATNRYNGSFGAQKEQGLEQRRYTYLVSKRIVKVYAPQIGYGWDEAIDSAFKVWNGQKAGISFARGSSNTSNTLITTYYQQDPAIAFSWLPNDRGQPGYSTSINTYYNYLSFPDKVYAITHEMGHIIGFTHTDEGSYILIAGTPLFDSLSIMNAVLQQWIGPSHFDSVAFKTIYP